VSVPDEELVNELNATIGFRITRVRRARGLRQEDIARAVGMSRSAIANAETGRQRLPVHALLAVAQALGLELADLFVTDRPIPSLAQRLPEGVGSEVADALAQLDQAREVLDKLTATLTPLTDGVER